MRKAFTLGIWAMSVIALVAATASVASSREPVSEKTSAKTASSAAIAKATSNHVCSPEEMASCAARMGVKLEECKKLCASGDIEMIKMSIKGMTGGDSESTVSATLRKVPCVISIHNVSYRKGTALVCIDASKAGHDDLVKAVTDMGYRVEIVPIVAEKTDKSVTRKTGLTCRKTCGVPETTCPKKCKTDKPK